MSRPDQPRGAGGVQVRLDAPRRGSRRRRVVLAVSLAANLALGWLVAGRLRDQPGAADPSDRLAEVQPVRPAWAVRPTPVHEAATPGAARLDVYEPFTWGMLPSADLAALRDALRERECPERVVRVILRGILKRELDARVETLLRPGLENFWGWLDLGDPKKFEALGNAINDVEVEIKARYEALTEGVPEPREPAAKPWDSSLAFLPDDKHAAVLELSRQFDERYQSLVHIPKGLTQEQVTAALRELQAEHQAAVDALLTEEEREELRLRKSDHADRLRELQEIELGPDELRDIAAARGAHAARWETEGEALKDQARDEFRQRLREEEKTALRQRLGEERLTELVRAEDGDYRETMAIVRRLGLPEATGRELWDLAESLYATHRAEQPKPAATVAELAARADREVARLLGGDRHAIATYRRHQLKWLTEAQAEAPEDPYDRDW